MCGDRRQVQSTKADAEKDGVTVPMTLQDYCVTSKTQSSSMAASAALVEVDFCDDDDDDDDYVDDDDDLDPDEDSTHCTADCEGDSGHGDSWPYLDSICP